eukprot:Polyplicarium_translucidae@DN1741_c0_g1_i1.p2
MSQSIHGATLKTSMIASARPSPVIHASHDDDGPTELEEISTGTTIMAVRCAEGVVLGADTRTSAGNFIANRASRKVSRIHDNIFVCRSGSAADTQALASFVKLYLEQHASELGPSAKPTVTAAASLFRHFAYEYKDALSAGLIVAGVDERHGPQVFAIPLGGTMLQMPYAVGGSGSTYITALVDATFRDDFTIAEAEEFVAKCVAHAMARDGSSGGLVRLTTVRRDGVVSEKAITDLPFGP